MRVVSPPQPIVVSPGFEFLSTPDMEDTDGRYLQWRRHQQLQSEMRDPTWAPRVEAALRNGIEDALTAQGFDIFDFTDFIGFDCGYIRGTRRR